MSFYLLASFPNSRQKSRNPTQKAVTYQVTVGNLGDPLTMVALENPNRTYIILKNLNETFDLLYIYASTVVINPMVTALFGVKNQLVYNMGLNTLYQKQSDGLGTDWIVVQMQNVAEKIGPLQSASLESLESIWCLTEAVGPIVPGMIVDIDEGRG